MASEHEKLVEDCARQFCCPNQKCGGEHFSDHCVVDDNTRDRIRSVLALIAERTKKATPEMITAAFNSMGCHGEFPDAFRDDCKDAIEDAHAASALWPPRDGKKDENNA